MIAVALLAVVGAFVLVLVSTRQLADWQIGGSVARLFKVLADGVGANAAITSFNTHLRDKCLNVEWFQCLDDTPVDPSCPLYCRVAQLDKTSDCVSFVTPSV